LLFCEKRKCGASENRLKGGSAANKTRDKACKKRSSLFIGNTVNMTECLRFYPRKDETMGDGPLSRRKWMPEQAPIGDLGERNTAGTEKKAAARDGAPCLFHKENPKETPHRSKGLKGEPTSKKEVRNCENASFFNPGLVVKKKKYERWEGDRHFISVSEKLFYATGGKERSKNKKRVNKEKRRKEPLHNNFRKDIKVKEGKLL